mmetsp:Transcript_36669/g.62430  ORF Transcript_36669/g.62430 Transcript_36669/m.62430 type:complete len:202 (-) Transcript_36669:54-659(-)
MTFINFFSEAMFLVRASLSSWIDTVARTILSAYLNASVSISMTSAEYFGFPLHNFLKSSPGTFHTFAPPLPAVMVANAVSSSCVPAVCRKPVTLPAPTLSTSRGSSASEARFVRIRTPVSTRKAEVTVSPSLTKMCPSGASHGTISLAMSFWRESENLLSHREASSAAFAILSRGRMSRNDALWLRSKNGNMISLRLKSLE